MRLKVTLQATVCAVLSWSGPTLHADSDAGDFQRAIEHDRAFQREMDDQRAKTDAANKGSTFTPPPSQAVSAQAWLNALDEQKRRQAEANAARWRDNDLREQREREKKAAEQQSERAAAARVQAITNALTVSAQPLLAHGIDPVEAKDLARYLTPYQGSYFDADSNLYVREAVQHAVQAKSEFDAKFATASYTELDDLVVTMYTGTHHASGMTFGPRQRKLICLPLSSLRARARLQERFHTEKSARDLAAACEEWPRSGVSGLFDDAQQEEVFRLSVRAALDAGRGETALIAQIENPAAKSFVQTARAFLPALMTSAYTHAVARLQQTTDPTVMKAEGEIALNAAEGMIAHCTRENRWSEVVEWQVRRFELPGLQVTLAAQAGFRLLLTEHPALLDELSPEQWTRLAGVPRLAIPELLTRLPAHLDRTRQPTLWRNVQISQAAQADDRAAALTLAYECRRTNDGVIEDPQGLSRALAVATAASATEVVPAQRSAIAQARAFQVFLLGERAPTGWREALTKDAASGVRESAFVLALFPSKRAPTATERAEKRAALEKLGYEPLWSGRVYGPSVRNALGFAWSEDPEAADGMSRARALWREGAKAGDVTCMAALGLALTAPKTSAVEWKEGRPWLDAAAEAGEPAAAARKGLLLARGACGYNVDEVASVPLLRRGIVVNRDSAPYYLGLAYANGRGVAKDPAEAVRCWTLVKGNFQPEAAMALADAYVRGAGVPEDRSKAAGLVRPLAESGHAAAQNYYGTMLSKGYVPNAATTDAVTWWKKSAAQGNFIAARNLFATSIRTLKAKSERSMAVAELERFLENATPRQQFQGGELFLHEGPATFDENLRDEERGRMWIRKAAERGEASAIAWLAANPVPSPEI
jgi:TPR repeat protein